MGGPPLQLKDRNFKTKKEPQEPKWERKSSALREKKKGGWGNRSRHQKLDYWGLWNLCVSNVGLQGEVTTSGEGGFSTVRGADKWGEKAMSKKNSIKNNGQEDEKARKEGGRYLEFERQARNSSTWDTLEGNAPRNFPQLRPQKGVNGTMA